MNIKTEFTAPECEYFRQVCNFTDDERAVFDLRVQGKSTAEIYFALYDTPHFMSERSIERRLHSIKRKIYKVL